ncbi:NAD(P)-binding domain-containing protein [Ferruginibacter lapsinanis]|uniref:NADPH-dependent F420 reductase n=1 Tax=Ferruginibacter lapsinanis TaxID=563172 RepID=UPI001E53FB2A|nr:NAD(P)-binding domain-containing protein [Ferruginibacter lapsinanis]UEG51098.1 NAD(P)-binding domain-containing protein [Ferruginibacter lapsinanis]
MQVGIIGSGIVGRVLATGLLKEGHQVMLGTRDIAKEEVVKWKEENSGGLTGTFSETAIFGDLIIIATGGLVTEAAIKLAGIENFKGKTVIDTTNPIAAAPPVNGVLQYFTSMNESLMERIQQLIPNANVVKAFNSVGNAFMYKPDFGGITPTMFICGYNDEAKKTVTEILHSFGWETEDMGKAEAARAIEPLCILWCIPGFINNQWSHAFKLLKK